MVDSCFKVFRKTKCLNKKRCDSFESFYMNENKCTSENNGGAKIYNINSNATNITNNNSSSNNNNEIKTATELPSELIINDIDHHDSEVVLRRHNRKYLHSISTVSNDAMSSDDDDETLDILYPLPHVNTHERSLNNCSNNNNSTNNSTADDTKRGIDKNNGK